MLRVLVAVSGISQASSASEQLRKPLCYDDFLSIRRSKEADRQSHFVPKKRKGPKETVTVSHSILVLSSFAIVWSLSFIVSAVSYYICQYTVIKKPNVN